MTSGQPRFARIITIEALLLALLVLSVTLTNPSPAAALPGSFSDRLVATVESPTDIAFTPGGRLVVASQPGVLYMLVSGTMTPILDLSDVTCSDFERGMLGVAFDPDFGSTRHIFVFYTYAKYGGCPANSATSPVNRVSRFTMSGNTVVRSSETVLIDGMPSPNGNHNAGDIAFGNDGMLYVAIGDGGCQLSDPSRCGGQNRNARLKNVLTGKILRITKGGGIPSANPYTGSDSERCGEPGGDGRTSKTYCQETYAWGLRNPFRIAFDPNSARTRFSINDVGQNTWEEIDAGAKAADYGWNTREGFCANGSTSDCGAPPAGMTNPVFAYGRGDGCGSITGGAFVPAGIWPTSYDADYLFADYVCGKIFRLHNGRSIEFASGVGPITVLAFGPSGRTQALYYAGYNGQVRRITYTGAVNRPPVGKAAANPTFGLTPLAVAFDAAGSSDPDGDPLTYAWDFADGSGKGSGVKISHTFVTAGVFNVKLTVSDGRGGSNTTTVKIDAGNTPPAPAIAAPLPADRFAVGQTITLQGSALDEQEGVLPDSALFWSVRLKHDQHEHPYFSGTGNNLTFIAPAPEDLLAAGNSHLIVTLTATDGAGLKATVTQDLLPRTVNVTLDSDPPGAQLLVEGAPITAGTPVVTWAGNTLDLSAPDQIMPDGEAIRFAAWSVPGPRELTFVVPDTDVAVTASFTTLSGPVFAPVADARVRESAPARNDGGSTGLTTKGGTTADYQTVMRFNVTGLGDAEIASATLYLFAYEGTIDGPTVYRSTGAWTETGVTWNNRPSPTGRRMDNAGAIASRSWLALDVTPAVTGDGTVDLLLYSSSSDAVSFYSREAASRRPRLVVVTSGPGGDTSAPSIPADLAADAPSSSAVALTWSPSTDDVGVAGYDVVRDGVLLTTTVNTSYVDASVKPERDYVYQVRARDASGNRSALTDPVSVRTPAKTRTVTITPTDDARVAEAAPSTSYGFSPQLRVEGGADPDIESYLRFELTSLPGPVYRASLRIWVPVTAGAGTDDGPALYVAASSWNEGSLTWSNRPTRGTKLGDVGAVAAGSWVEYDVTARVSGNGRYAFVLVSESTDVIVFSSKEGAVPPRLVVTAFTAGAAVAPADEPSALDTATVAPTPAATATAAPDPSPTPEPLPIADDFERGHLAGWEVVGNAHASQDSAEAGTWSLVVDSDGSPARARRALPEPLPELFVRLDIAVLLQGDHSVDLLTLIDERGRAMVTLLIDADGQLAVRNERTGRVTAFHSFPAARWRTIQLHLRAHGGESAVEIWVEGKLLYQDDVTLRRGMIAAVQLGDDHSARAFSVAFDNIVLDKECIGACSTVLVTPAPEPAPEATAAPTEAPPPPSPALTEPPAPVEPTSEPTSMPTPEPTVAEEATAAPTVQPDETSPSEPTVSEEPAAEDEA